MAPLEDDVAPGADPGEDDRAVHPAVDGARLGAGRGVREVAAGPARHARGRRGTPPQHHPRHLAIQREAPLQPLQLLLDPPAAPASPSLAGGTGLDLSCTGDPGGYLSLVTTPPDRYSSGDASSRRVRSCLRD